MPAPHRHSYPLKLGPAKRTSTLDGTPANDTSPLVLGEVSTSRPPSSPLFPSVQHPVSAWRHPFSRARCLGVHCTYTILPRQPSQLIFGELSLSVPRTQGLSTFLSENRPTTDTFHLEFAGVHKMSLLSTPTLVPVEMVRSSGVWALTGHYLVDMLPRDGVSSETESFVANEYQTTPLSRSTELEPGDLLGTFSSVLIQISTSALQDITTEPLITDIHDLHENIPVANDGPPQIELPPPPKYSAQSSWNA